jgi:hypothetical protein
MTSSHYVVAEQGHSSWHYSHKGDMTGPFTTRDAAVAAAVAEAKASGDPHAEVVVRDADLKSQIVWQAGPPSDG